MFETGGRMPRWLYLSCLERVRERCLGGTSSCGCQRHDLPLGPLDGEGPTTLELPEDDSPERRGI